MFPPTDPVIVCDVDGTLLDGRKRISRRTADVFQALYADFRATFILASSRMPASLRLVERSLGVPCAIAAYDGAHLERSDGATIDQEPTVISLGAPMVAEALARSGAYIGAYFENVWITDLESDWSAREVRNTGVAPDVNPDLRITFSDLFPDGVHKLMIRDEQLRVAEIRKALSEIPAGGAKFYGNSDTILELLPAQADKFAAVERILAVVGREASDVIAFGDGFNDLSLMRNLSHGVAVANAKPDVRASAWRVAQAGVDDGVAKFLAELFFAK